MNYAVIVGWCAVILVTACLAELYLMLELIVRNWEAIWKVMKKFFKVALVTIRFMTFPIWKPIWFLLERYEQHYWLSHCIICGGRLKTTHITDGTNWFCDKACQGMYHHRQTLRSEYRRKALT